MQLNTSLKLLDLESARYAKTGAPYVIGFNGQ